MASATPTPSHPLSLTILFLKLLVSRIGIRKSSSAPQPLYVTRVTSNGLQVDNACSNTPQPMADTQAFAGRLAKSIPNVGSADLRTSMFTLNDICLQCCHQPSNILISATYFQVSNPGQSSSGDESQRLGSHFLASGLLLLELVPQRLVVTSVSLQRSCLHSLSKISRPSNGGHS